MVPGGPLGGTCLNVGCIPSKALLHASELYEIARLDFASLGIDATTVKLNLPNMMKQKADSVAQLTRGIEFLFKKNKVDWLKGVGTVSPRPGKVAVTATDGAATTARRQGYRDRLRVHPVRPPGRGGGQQADRRFHRRSDVAGGPQDADRDRRRGDPGWSWARSGAGWARKSPWWNTWTGSRRVWTRKPPGPYSER